MSKQADTMVIHWLSLVTDEKRSEWEEYAEANRAQIDDAFQEDEDLRTRQDIEFNLHDTDNNSRMLQQVSDNMNMTTNMTMNMTTPDNMNMTMTTPDDDGTGFHPTIWSFATREAEPEGSGPFLPVWQRRYVTLHLLSRAVLCCVKAIADAVLSRHTSQCVTVRWYTNSLII